MRWDCGSTAQQQEEEKQSSLHVKALLSFECEAFVVKSLKGVPMACEIHFTESFNSKFKCQDFRKTEMALFQKKKCYPFVMSHRALELLLSDRQQPQPDDLFCCYFFPRKGFSFFWLQEAVNTWLNKQFLVFER